MSNKTSPNIRVTTKIYAGNLSRCEKIETELEPTIYDLSSQINKLIQKIENGARAALLKQYADIQIEELSSTGVDSHNNQSTAVSIVVNYNGVGTACFKGEELPLTIKDISENDIFHWSTIENAKAKLAIKAVEFFEALAK